MSLKALEQQPCVDAISRQAAIDTIESWLSCDDYNKAERHIMRAMQSVLYDFPSVKTQEPNVEELQKRSYLEGFHEALKMINNEALKKAVYARSKSEEEYETND